MMSLPGEGETVETDDPNENDDGPGTGSGRTVDPNADPNAATGSEISSDDGTSHSAIDSGMDGTDSSDSSEIPEGPQGPTGHAGARGRRGGAPEEIVYSSLGGDGTGGDDGGTDSDDDGDDDNEYVDFQDVVQALEVESEETKSGLSKRTKIVIGATVGVVGGTVIAGGLGFLLYYLFGRGSDEDSSTPTSSNQTPPAPQAVDDNIEFNVDDTGNGAPKGRQFTYDVLANDIPVNTELTIDKSSVLIFDPKQETDGSKTLTIENEGTWTVGDEGAITFQPIDGFFGAASPIEYSFKTSDGVSSNKAEISGLTYFPLDKKPEAGLITWGTGENGRKTRKIMTIKGEGTWTTIKGPDGVETGEVEFTPLPGFTKAPSPVRFQIADSKGNGSKEAILSISDDFYQVHDIIQKQSEISESDYWSTFHTEINDDEVDLVEIDFMTNVMLRTTRNAIVAASDTETYRIVQNLFPADKLDDLMEKWLGDDANTNSLTTLSDIEMPEEVKAIPLGERATRLWIINSLVTEINSDSPDN